MSLIHSLNLIFRDAIPSFILINFILLIVLIFLNWEYIKKFLARIDKKTWILLVLIFCSALFARVFIPYHQHLKYIDEAGYMEAGKNMLQTGSQDYYPKSIGWPFILRIAFGIFGVSNWVALYASTLLGSLTIFTIFFMTLIITQRKIISLVAALLFSLFPVHIIWSASAETNVASLFFISLTIFFCFLYYRNRKNSLLWLALVSLAFTAQFRPENYIFPLLFLFGCFIYDKVSFKRIKLEFVLPWIVLIILPFADLVQSIDFLQSTNWIENESGGEQSGSNWSFHNLIYNSSHYGVYIFNSEFQPVLFSLLIFPGLIYMFFKQRREELFLMVWFLLLWFAYFFSWFVGGVPSILGKTRFFMGFYPITIIFVCYGLLLVKDLASNIKNSLIKKLTLPLIILILVIFFIPYSFKASELFDSPAHRLEAKIPELAEKDIPSDCIIIANLPTILKSTTDLNVIDAGEFLDYPKIQEEVFNHTSCVLFFEDLTCSLFEFTEERCRRVKDEFLMEPFTFYSEKDKKFTFYKINRQQDL